MAGEAGSAALYIDETPLSTCDLHRDVSCHHPAGCLSRNRRSGRGRVRAHTLDPARPRNRVANGTPCLVALVWRVRVADERTVILDRAVDPNDALGHRGHPGGLGGRAGVLVDGLAMRGAKQTRDIRDGQIQLTLETRPSVRVAVRPHVSHHERGQYQHLQFVSWCALSVF